MEKETRVYPSAIIFSIYIYGTCIYLHVTIVFFSTLWLNSSILWIPGNLIIGLKFDCTISTLTVLTWTFWQHWASPLEWFCPMGSGTPPLTLEHFLLPFPVQIEMYALIIKTCMILNIVVNTCIYIMWVFNCCIFLWISQILWAIN